MRKSMWGEAPSRAICSLKRSVCCIWTLASCSSLHKAGLKVVWSRWLDRSHRSTHYWPVPSSSRPDCRHWSSGYHKYQRLHWHDSCSLSVCLFLRELALSSHPNCQRFWCQSDPKETHQIMLFGRLYYIIANLQSYLYSSKTVCFFVDFLFCLLPLANRFDKSEVGKDSK